MSSKIISMKDAATELLRLYNNGEKVAYFSEKDFMENGPGRLVSLADFKFVEYFFSGKNDSGKALDFSSFKRYGKDDIILTHKELVSLIYTDSEKIKEANKATIAFNNYKAGHLSGDIGNRAFAFGSSEFKLDTENIRYRNEKPNIKANNTVSFSAQPNPKLDANSDAVVISRSRKAIVNKHTLNQHSDPASVAKSSIITDDMRVLITMLPNP